MSISIEDINLSNDLVFGEVMRQPENVTPFLEAVLEKKIANITYIEKQQDIKDGIHLHGIGWTLLLLTMPGHSTTSRCRQARHMTWRNASAFTRAVSTVRLLSPRRAAVSSERAT
ncbi:hypothetical protein I5Q82_11060 [Acutalibacter muris]|uniref:Uncharacterized protein n=1 Tax=Acutalibacter muris TaxID=1796620 RepID=A0AA92L3C9_9FIRM|nr:hypothetical protein [Acutalibacter muris]QQR28661.1 hypothetical protein I5Q82_11060 [Acutalibacter muris]